MSDFKGRHFGGEIVLWAVRWYCRYPISYRDLETMMTERGVSVDHYVEDGLRHDQGLRGDARATQGPSWDIRSPGRHRR